MLSRLNEIVCTLHASTEPQRGPEGPLQAQGPEALEAGSSTLVLHEETTAGPSMRRGHCFTPLNRHCMANNLCRGQCHAQVLSGGGGMLLFQE